MQVIVKNFRGISEAQIEVSPVALLCGLNGAGKTSMARAIAAAATGKAVPFPKVTKKDCGVMLRHGSKAGMAVLATGDGTTTVEWPKAEVQTNGLPISVSEIAAGLTDLLSMKEDAALAYLIDLLKANPDLEDIKAEFIGPNSTQEEVEHWTKTAEKIWKVIEAQGWPAAHKQAVETGAKLKGAWQQVTGTAYGKDKARSWFPDGWDDDLLEQTPESITEALTEARAQLEQAIGKSAVSQAERQRLEELAGRLPGLEKLVADKLVARDEAEKALKAAEEKLRGVPNPDARKDYECPHCQGAVHVSSVSGSDFLLTKAVKINEAKLKQARLEYAGLCGDQQRLSRELQACQFSLADATKNRDDALEASKKLEGMGEAGVADSQSGLDAARARADRLQLELQILGKYQEATKVEGQIAKNQTIIDALDETGIRKKKLSNSLTAFCESWLLPLSDSLGMPPVTIDTDLAVKSGKTPFPMLSASEQFRVRTALQIAIAQLEKAGLVIIDGADILDKDGRARLMNIVVGLGIPAVVCMTLNRPDMAPDLAAAGVGATYWVEKGTCTKQQTERKAA